MKVIAIESMKDGVLKVFGEGEYIGDKIPDVEPFKNNGIENPCIKLDSGKYVWGFQCWWGDLLEFRDKYKDHIKSEETVKIENEIRPV